MEHRTDSVQFSSIRIREPEPSVILAPKDNNMDSTSLHLIPERTGSEYISLYVFTELLFMGL